MGKILVIGSSNTDLVAKVRSFPKAGETIEGLSYFQAMGGKGANQAMAAHKLGGDVKFVTSLGSDPNGQNALKYYQAEGLDVSLSLIVEDISSGTAMIMVDEKGENCIVITPGANKMLSPDYIGQIEDAIAAADIVMVQLEIPYDTVRKIGELTSKHNRKLILNAAPARRLDEEIIKKIDILIVNETEAEAISGIGIENSGNEKVIDALLSMGAKAVVLTLGKNGSIYKDCLVQKSVPAFDVEPIDTTGAGDTFCGALAVGISKGHSWDDILKFATAASAICITRMGAQPSIPKENEVLALLDKNIELV